MSRDDLREEIEANVSIAMLAGTRSPRISCPFHGSADLDLKLYHDDNKWRCYGACDDGKPHNIFDWVMREQGIDFSEAFRFLADLAGVSLRPNTERVEILTGVQRYYHEQLLKRPDALAYLRRRGFGEELIFQRQMGYSAKDDMPDPDLISIRDQHKVGLVQAGDFGLYNWFRNQIVYPVYDKNYNQVQMQGRVFPDREGCPKYMALPTEVELKGTSIYQCLGGAEILRDMSVTSALMCEGFPDRETLTAWGIKAVNIFGHSGLYKHAGNLKDLKHLYVVLDPDKASQTRILPELYQLAMRMPHVEIRNVFLKTNGLDLNAWGMQGKPEGELLSPRADAVKIEQLRTWCRESNNLIEDLINAWAPRLNRLDMLALLIAKLPDPEPWIHMLSRITMEDQKSIRFLIKVLAPQ